MKKKPGTNIIQWTWKTWLVSLFKPYVRSRTFPQFPRDCTRKKCSGSEEAVQNRLESIAEHWELLTQKTSEKSMKLKEANRQRTFIAAVKDLDLWLGEVESILTTDEVGKDLASTQNLMKKTS